MTKTIARMGGWIIFFAVLCGVVWYLFAGNHVSAAPGAVLVHGEQREQQEEGSMEKSQNCFLLQEEDVSI